MSNLFPPIVDSTMPAFLKNQACRIYFSLSSYNIIDDIKNCQVRLTYLVNNRSALKTVTYPSEIKICSILVDGEIEGDAKYYITINPTDLQSNIFDIQQYYKVQLRFTESDASNPPISGGLDSWLANNIEYFSEWSEVCLIKAISQPIVSLNHNISFIPTSSSLINNSILVQLFGNVKFTDSNDMSYIKSFNVIIKKDDEIIEQSEEILIDSVNSLNKISYEGYLPKEQQTITYNFILTFTTDRLYKFTANHLVSVENEPAAATDLQIQTTTDEENGRIIVTILPGETGFNGTFVIVRASNKDNFNKWYDVHKVETNLLPNQYYIWSDNSTVQSGVFYQYGVQEESSGGIRSDTATIENPCMVLFQHTYLNTDKLQLNIKFDPNISSFQKRVLEGINETIGSKYPFIRRNAQVGYRTFDISGTISCLIDETASLMKASKQDVYGQYKEWYDNFNNQHKINIYNDYIYEKEFRDKVIDFLYQDDVKLFRSATEGNILVKLTGVSLTPNQSLSRRIYSFSCTAYEIDDFTLDNCKKYKTLDLSQGGVIVSTIVNNDFEQESVMSKSIKTTDFGVILNNDSDLSDSYTSN